MYFGRRIRSRNAMPGPVTGSNWALWVRPAVFAAGDGAGKTGPYEKVQRLGERESVHDVSPIFYYEVEHVTSILLSHVMGVLNVLCIFLDGIATAIPVSFGLTIRKTPSTELVGILPLHLARPLTTDFCISR
jgi:hypothetical protein